MIIGISGKIGSGKDEIGRIIQYLSSINDHYSYQKWIDYQKQYGPDGSVAWEIKRFADKLKDMVCMLLGCTREQLEDREFKEAPLGDDWGYIDTGGDGVEVYDPSRTYTYFEMSHLEHLTPRRLLQLLGTDCGREIIHPNIWVNSLMADYKTETVSSMYDSFDTHQEFPNWVVTDTRFPNEADAILSKGGIVIRVNRNSPCGDAKFVGSDKEWAELIEKNKKENAKFNHPSETALDNYNKFTHVIDNNGTIDDLVEKIRALMY